MLAEKIKLIARKKIEDHRGYFLKVINGMEEGLPSHTGEVYVTMAKPGEMKGGHYHPIAKEWFTLITGKCLVNLTDMLTGEHIQMEIDVSLPQTLFVPNNIAHSFTNTSTVDDFILLAYSDQLYIPEDTILYQFR